MTEEIWKDIPGYEGYYQISNLGRVKSLERLTYFKNGQKPRKEKEKILSLCPGSFQYLIINLTKGNVKKCFKVHRLVAIAFIPNPENKPEVNHKDGNRINNNVNNLEWVTKLENAKHSWKYLNRRSSKSMLGKFGSDHNTSKTVYQFSLTGDLLAQFGSTREAGRMTGIHPTMISACAIGKRNTAGKFKWSYNNPKQ